MPFTQTASLDHVWDNILTLTIKSFANLLPLLALLCPCAHVSSAQSNSVNSMHGVEIGTEIAANINRPPMGWSSWNSFSNLVDAQIVVEQTKAVVASGMKQAGYQYVNIDEGW